MLYNDPSNRDYDPRLKTTKVDLFLVSIDKSVDELEEILQEFQLSLWWNVTVPYFVLGSSKNSCGDAQIVLKTFWKMKSVCEGFTFDRTKYLDRATVNVISPIRQIHTYHLIIKEALRGVLNVSISYDLDDCKEIYLTKRFLNIEKQGDITQCFRPITNLPYFKSYPINSYAAYALSNNLRVPLKININFLSIHRLFYSIFIFLIILQAIFKGQYIKWLIISESSTNIVSLEKLSNNTDKKVFISNDINTGNDLEYWFMGYKYVNNLKCIEEVLKDKSTIHFFQTCEKDYKTIALHKDVSESIIKSLSGLEKITVILQKDLPRTELNFLRKNKVDLFIVTLENSIDNLNQILLDLKTSLRWEIMIPHFVLSNLENGCKDARSVLKMVWQQNILNCYYVCFDSKGELFVYTFNPYSSRFPYQWRMVEEISNKSIYMAIYNRPYNEAEICNGFNFDRTKQHDKTATKILANTDFVFRDSYELSKAIEVFFNASLTKIILWDCDPRLEEYRSQKKTTDFVMCLQNYETIAKLDNLTATYPISINGHYIFSKNQRYLSPLEKNYNSLGINMIIITLVLSIIIYVVILNMTSFRSYSFAIVEILRLWVGFSINTEVKSQPLRVFFTPIFMYFLVMQSTLQGDLTEFLSKTELRQNANSITDLQRDYYNKVLIVEYISSNKLDFETIQSKVIDSNESYCVETVIKDDSSACLIGDHRLMSELKAKINSTIQLQNFYVSKYPIDGDNFAYCARRDWPLREKFDIFLMHLESFGINRKLLDGTPSHLRIKSNLQTSRYVLSYQQISFDSLSFIFL
ncbi:Protein of unknown function [Cotesia congregata]|uniref:Uncharacterized protein n=1 Tax=Cotesia congregata TaxID=51543 RepID=A0A8J2HJS3_COTCN|nr:Protein of unknown function [Cotesia congregata]